MDMDYERKLVLKYPELCKGYNNKNFELYYGFECSNGWFMLLNDMLLELNNTNNKNIEILSIKEKGGKLVININNENEIVKDIINKYILKSITVCEYCGKNGNIRKIRGYQKTLCSNCMKIFERKIFN